MFIDLEMLKKGVEKIGLICSDEQLDQLNRYSQLLLKWNKVYNLTSLRNPEDVLTHHILDSLAIVPIYRERVKEDAFIVDVGSGGGLPAIPLAIMNPNYRVTMIDTVGKKCAFLTQCIVELGLKNAQVINNRVEKIAELNCDVLSSRAFSTLSLFVELTHHLLKSDGVWLAMKGQYPQVEIESLPKDAEVNRIYKIKVPYLNEDRHLVEMRKVSI